MKKHIPNTITCCNLICGCLATFYAFQQDYSLALTFIISGAVFDFFDGFMARLLGVSSPIGKELDSLADDITFGFAPAAVVYSLLKEVPGLTGIESIDAYLPYAAFLIAAFSALRLAKFNLDERQATTFFGLPTPANALFWGALALGFRETLIEMPYAAALLIGGVLLSSWILVSDIPMFALKFKHYGWKGNGLRYTFALLSLLLLIFLGWSGFSLIIILYVLTSIANNFSTK
jgi:CDP-diacylglycerol--serine O-phosphatidyltransferase